MNKENSTPQEPQPPNRRDCADRVTAELQERIRDLTRLWNAYRNGTDDEDDSLYDYGLCFDYVAAGMFRDQSVAYFRWQLSWGGPSDEFRFFVNPDLSCHRIEYWFLDWFGGAHRVLTGADKSLLLELWCWFCDLGSAEAALCKSRRG